jgi:hypothetical protein
MTAPTLQLLQWVSQRTPTYAETVDVWKTSCPRLSVWEDAVADRLVRIERGTVYVTAAGQAILDS